MKLKLLLPILGLVFGLASCKRDGLAPDGGNDMNNSVTNMEDLIVPNGFGYETTQDLTLDVILTDGMGQPMRGVKVDVLDAPADGLQQRNVFATGITDANGVLRTPMSIPTYMKTVTVYPYIMGVPNNVEVPVSGKTVKFHVLNGKIQTLVVAPYTDNAGGGISRKAGIADKYSFRLGSWNSNGVPNYLTTNDTVSSAFLTRVMNALPEQKSVPTYKSQYLNNILPVVEVNQTADVWITFVHEGASLKNSLFYYKYHKNSPPSSVNDIDSLYTVFPNSSFSGSGGGLSAGNRVWLGQFGADTIIGFAMAANGFNGSAQVTAGLNVWYSHKAFNNEATFYKDHALMLFDSATQRYLIAFEDVRRDAGGSDQDFNDAVFYASANPPTGIGNPDIPPINPTPDCDSDGVPDFYDDYPCDPTKAYDRYFPSKTEYGTLAYEDLWPGTGDYDMNDLVVRWRFHAVVNAQNNVLELNCKAYPEAKGGNLHCGFAVEFPFNASLVSQVTGSQINHNFLTMAGNGLEAGHTKAVMVLFDEATDHLSFPGGSMFNTRRFAPVSIPDTINTKMTFTNTMAFTSLGTYPFNPFLFTSGVYGTKNRTREIHLPNKANTPLANTSLFGTSRDNSIPGNNRYYVTTNNLPWALHIPVKFNYPAEKSAITTAHLKFANWVQSNGTTNADWYEDKPGYRSSTNIYVP